MSCNCDISDVLKYDSANKTLTINDDVALHVGTINVSTAVQVLNKGNINIEGANSRINFGPEGATSFMQNGNIYAASVQAPTLQTDGKGNITAGNITATGSVRSTGTLYVGAGTDTNAQSPSTANTVNFWTPGGVMNSTSYIQTKSAFNTTASATNALNLCEHTACCPTCLQSVIA